MTVIKIPSSNIYGIGDKNSLISSNKIQKAELNFNKYTRTQGNILTKNYVATFYEENNPDGETELDSEMLYVGNDMSKNDFEFEFGVESTAQRVYAKLIGEAKMQISKPINIDVDKYSSHYNVVIEQKWLIFETKNLITTKKYETKVINASKKVFYNEDDNSFSLDFSTDYGNSLILIYHQDYFKEGENEEAVSIVTTGYLLSESVYIEGKYFEPEEKTHSYGSVTSQDSLSLPTNSLIQENKVWEDVPLWSDKVLQNVVKRYSKGKEVYELKCSLANYYDVNKKLIICPTDANYPTTFQKYDIVEPYIFTSSGEVPLSTTKENKPKFFEIIGIDFEYKGVVFQKLTIQEGAPIQAKIISAEFGTITIYFSPMMTWREWVDSDDGQLYSAYYDGNTIRLYIGDVDHELQVESIDEEIISASEYIATQY